MNDVEISKKKKPFFRGWNHLILSIVNIPVTFLYLYPIVDNIAENLAVSLFYISSTLLYSMSSLLHLKYWSRKEYKLMKKIDHSAILLSIYFNQLVVALLLLKNELIFFFTLTFISSFVFPTCLKEIVEEPENHINSYIKQSIILIPIIPYMIFTHTAYANLMMFISFSSYLIGLKCYVSKKPVLSKNIFGYHEVFHLLTTISYICNVEYIRELINVY
jgi:hemolysin III